MSSNQGPAENHAFEHSPSVGMPAGAKATHQQTGGDREVFALRSTSAWCVMLGVLILALGIDLTAKHLAFRYVGPEPVDIVRDQVLRDPLWSPPKHPDVHVLPWSLLDLRLVINHGAVFGIGSNRRFLFIVFTMAALGAGLYLFARRTTNRQHRAHVALALILAGGLGNLYDRIVYGVVRDFLHMMPDWHLPFSWRYPHFLGGGSEVFPWVFNCADVMLLSGMALLLLHINALERRKQQEETPATSPVGQG